MSNESMVVAEVVSYNPAGFTDRSNGGFETYPAALLDVVTPNDVAGSELTLVLDVAVAGVENLVAGHRVQLMLDPEAAGMDVVFSAALLDRAIHPATAIDEGASDEGGGA